MPDQVGATVALVAPSAAILGGQGIQARALLENFGKEGRRVFLLPIDPVFPRGLRWIRRVPFARTAVNLCLYLPSLIRLQAADVVHVFSASYWSFLVAQAPALVAARVLGKRVILNYHSGEADDHLEHWGVLVHPWLRLAHEVVVPSEYLRAVFRRHGYDVFVVPNVVDTSRFRYRERAPLRPRCVSVRNLERMYAVDNTIEAFARVLDRFAEATLTIAGYGSEERRLRNLAAARAPGAVRFVGRVEPRDMPYLLDEADIFLNSSVVDNQPLSVLEAFAAGLPVVTTPTGDIANMVRDDETGRLVPPGDPAAMANAVIGLLKQPDRAAAIARHASAELERHSWGYIRERWTAIYAGRPA
jgi:glycosyltransferase involved in cell wall biosynthesis